MVRSWLSGPRILALLVIAAVAAAVWFLLRAPPLPVDVAIVARGPMAVTIDDLGETRVTDLYTVSSPVTGELLRIPFKPGAAVVRGRTIIAEVEPARPVPMDARSHAQTLAMVAGLKAQHAAAEARVREAQAALDLATVDFARVSRLAAKGFVAQARVDQARSELRRSRAAVKAAAQAQDAAFHAVEAEEALLDNRRTAPAAEPPEARAKGAGGSPAGRVVRIAAPISGTVLRVLQESGRPVLAGTTLLDIGDPARLEVVADLLSGDAVNVRAGAAVLIDAWGGEQPLHGVVRLVEPYGFTKISALGVEEQRVNVIIDFADRQLAWQRLGHGYRVTVHIARWSADNVLQVPLGALFRDGRNWAVYRIDDQQRARRQIVSLGHRNDEFAEVLGGLAAGQRIILHPTDKVAEGRKVAERR